MLSVDEAGDEPWGDVPYLQQRPPQLRIVWLDRVLAVLAMLAGAIGAMGALRLSDMKEHASAKETRRRG